MGKEVGMDMDMGMGMGMVGRHRRCCEEVRVDGVEAGTGGEGQV